MPASNDGQFVTKLCVRRTAAICTRTFRRIRVRVRAASISQHTISNRGVTDTTHALHPNDLINRRHPTHTHTLLRAHILPVTHLHCRLVQRATRGIELGHDTMRSVDIIIASTHTRM